jgi:hypothetical protein
VLSAKVVACAAGVFVLALAIEAVFASTLWLVSAAQGGTTGADATFAWEVGRLMLRVSAVAVFGGVLGLAIAMIARNTGAAIGIAFAYLAIGESIMRALKPAWQPWLIGDNANVVVLGRDLSSVGRSPSESALVLLLYATVFFVAAAGAFRTRDVN